MTITLTLELLNQFSVPNRAHLNYKTQKHLFLLLQGWCIASIIVDV